MAIVREYNFDGCVVLIDDSHCMKEEIDAVLKLLEEIYSRASISFPLEKDDIA